MKGQTQRLYIFTGKGGVGKTSLAMAMTKHLEASGVKVKYNSFYQDPEKDLWRALDLPALDIELYSSAETYIGRKLKSTTIASWIMKTHFFKSLFQMIPGLSHMILLGNVLDELEKDPELVVVLDSPASGHALTMFESSSNFKKIFRAGLIVKDIDRMHQFLSAPNHLKTVIVALPTELALSEAMDLKKELDSNPSPKLNAGIIINDSYYEYIKENNIEESELPGFLRNKISLEKEIVKDTFTLPHVDEEEQAVIIRKLTPYMEGVV